jgi:hypothetical protein
LVLKIVARRYVQMKDKEIELRRRQKNPEAAGPRGAKDSSYFRGAIRLKCRQVAGGTIGFSAM